MTDYDSFSRLPKFNPQLNLPDWRNRLNADERKLWLGLALFVASAVVWSHTAYAMGWGWPEQLTLAAAALMGMSIPLLAQQKP